MKRSIQCLVGSSRSFSRPKSTSRGLPGPIFSTLPPFKAKPWTKRPVESHMSSGTLRVSRSFATYQTGPEKKGFKISYLFGGLVGLGLLVTTYGLLEYYYSLQTWPEPIRTPLRAAIKARNRGDYDRSEKYFQAAIEAALSIPASALAPDPLLKISGLYITFAAMLESQGSMVQAYTNIFSAISLFGETPLQVGSPSGPWNSAKPLSSEDQLRAIGMYQKLGQLALQISSVSIAPPYPVAIGSTGISGTSKQPKPRDWNFAAEKYLSEALTAMLRIGIQPRPSGNTSQNSNQVIAGRDIRLPHDNASASGDPDGEEGGRVNTRGLGMTMESLSEVYARKGEYDMAAQLLLQAVSILLPSGASQPPPIRDRCQAAMLMTSISSHTLHPRTPKAINISKSWSLKALQIAEDGLSNSGDKSDPACKVCGRAKAIGLFNLGMLAEMEDDLQSARDNFSNSLSAAKDYGFSEGRREANDALRRIQNRTAVSTDGSWE